MLIYNKQVKCITQKDTYYENNNGQSHSSSSNNTTLVNVPQCKDDIKTNVTTQRNPRICAFN